MPEGGKKFLLMKTSCLAIVVMVVITAHKCIIIILQQADPEEYGWEYASLGRHTFHTTKGKFDVDRRRRHVRKLVNEKPGAKAVFALGKTEDAKAVKDDDKDGWKKVQVPRMHLEFKGKPHIWY